MGERVSSSKFKHIALVKDSEGKLQRVVVTFDTGCDHEGFISKALVERLGMQSAVYVPTPPAEGHESLPTMRCTCGQLIHASGAIKLDWIIHPNGTKVFCTLYYMVETAGSDHLDLVVGAKTLDRERLVIPNPSPIITLTQHEPKKKEEEEADAKAKEDQAKARAALEDEEEKEEKEKEEKSEQKGKGSSSQQGQGGQ